MTSVDDVTCNDHVDNAGGGDDNRSPHDSVRVRDKTIKCKNK